MGERKTSTDGSMYYFNRHQQGCMQVYCLAVETHFSSLVWLSTRLHAHPLLRSRIGTLRRQTQNTGSWQKLLRDRWRRTRRHWQLQLLRKNGWQRRLLRRRHSRYVCVLFVRVCRISVGVGVDSGVPVCVGAS